MGVNGPRFDRPDAYDPGDSLGVSVMLERRHILWAATAVMVGVAVVIAVIAITVQYRHDFEHHQQNLKEIVQVQAKLMEAVGRFDALYSEEDHPSGSRGATLSQIVDAQKELPGFGETGEFVIGERVGEDIIFLAPIRDGKTPASVPWLSTDAEPMRRAIRGESGIVRARDYDGIPVLAAYESVEGLGLGVVAKRDFAEIRSSIVQAAFFSGMAALLIIGLGAFIMHRAISPLFRRLEESEGRTRAIVETASEGIITIDERGIIESFNPQAEAMFGYEAREVVGQNVSMLMDSPRREEHDGYLERYLRTGEAKILGSVREVEGLRKDGRAFALELKANEMWMGERRVFTGFVLDISKRKEAEEKIRQSERRYRNIFEGTPVSTWEEDFSEIMEQMEVLRKEGVTDIRVYMEDHPEYVEQASRRVKVLDINQESVTMFEASSKEELLGSLDKTFTTDSLKVFQEELIALWEGEKHFHSEAVVKTLEGRLLNVIVGLTISYQEPARYRAWVSLVDITERKFAEEELLRERHLFVKGPVVVFRWVNDTGWPVEYVSPNVKEVFGYSAEDFMSGRVPYADIVHPDDLERVAGEVAGHSEAGLPTFNQEYRIVQPDGSIRWLADFTVVHQVNGIITHYEGYAYDATERKRAEDRQRRLMNELDHRVKNNLAAVIALAQQMALGPESKGECIMQFSGRLHAMARMHEVLASTQWEGVYMEKVCDLILSPFAEGRFQAQGERILLPSRAASPLSLTLHEMATNAVKYGSLSVPEGRVEICWFLEGDAERIRILWEERGGPAVTAPGRTGLGTSLIRGFIQHELGGGVDLDFRSTGLVATLKIPLDREADYNDAEHAFHYSNSLVVEPGHE